MVKGIDRRPQIGLLAAKSNFNGANCPGIVLQNPSYSQNYILGILNSSLCAYYLNAICPPKLNNTFRYNANNLNKVPIVGTSDDRLETLVAEMLTLTSTLSRSTERFITLTLEEFVINSWPERLQSWWTRGFSDLLVDLKIKTSMSKKDEFRDVWRKYSDECRSIANRIANLENVIDSEVYRIYQISETEGGLIEASFSGP